MFQIFAMCLMMLCSSIFAGQNSLASLTFPVAASVSPSDSASEDGDVDDDDSDDSGEADEDIIIEDDIDSNDDEGVNN